MATPISIAAAEDPRLEDYRDIRERDLTGRAGCFVVEGDVVLRKALETGRYPLRSVLLSEKRALNSPDLLARLPAAVPVYVAPDAVIEALAGFAVHRGVLAIGERGDLPSSAALIAGLPEVATVLVCIGIANHDNMGGLFRNAAAFGVSAVLLDETCCDPFYRKAIRVSVGAALTVPCARGHDGVSLMEELQHAGFATYGLSPSARQDLSQLVAAPRMAFCVGPEGPGLPEDVLKAVQGLRIPMADGFDSLNVATAAGIVLYEAATLRP